jgi:hypothetical protein
VQQGDGNESERNMKHLQSIPIGMWKKGRQAYKTFRCNCRINGLRLAMLATVFTVAAQAAPPAAPANEPPAQQPPPAPAQRGDPFAFRGSSGDADGFVNVPQTALPPGIRVVGILKPSDGAPIGAIAIPGQDSLHFVRAGDVIQIDPVANVPSASGQTAPLYLLIVSVTAEQIEIATRLRPQDARIYR